MKASITLGKVTNFIGLGFFTIKRLFTGKLEKEDFKTFLRKTIVPLASILLFIGLWHLGAKSLYNIEAEFKIEKALNRSRSRCCRCFKSMYCFGESSCQPNTLPSPVRFGNRYKSLLRDHNIISCR